MANPRQRRKARSSSHSAVSHSKKAKTLKFKKMPVIRGPKVLQEAWDKRKTVRQNYAALGLVHSLNPTLSGGVEQNEKMDDITEEPLMASGSSISTPQSIPKGYGRIVRDEDGNVVSVEMPEEEDEGDENDSDSGSKLPEAEVNPDVKHKWVSDLGGGGKGTQFANQVVQELQSIAAPCTASTTLSVPVSGVGARHSSSGEVTYLQALQAKYGADIAGMARDRKLNYMQRTEGELRRALKRSGL